MGKRTAREIICEIKWRSGMDMRLLEIEYVHRGAPGDIATLFGDDIIELSQLFMYVQRNSEEVQIPFHRIRRMVYDGQTIFIRDL